MKPKITTMYEFDEDGTSGSLGIDKNNQLYWNNEPIVTEQKVRLSDCVNWSIIIGGFSTLIIAIFTVLSYFNI